MTNAGYKILEIHQTSKPGETVRGFALGQAISPKTPCQWVTWRYIELEGSRVPNFYSGNYWNEEQKAREDLHRRISDSYAQHAFRFYFGEG